MSFLKNLSLIVLLSTSLLWASAEQRLVASEGQKDELWDCDGCDDQLLISSDGKKDEFIIVAVNQEELAKLVAATPAFADIKRSLQQRSGVSEDFKAHKGLVKVLRDTRENSFVSRRVYEKTKESLSRCAKNDHMIALGELVIPAIGRKIIFDKMVYEEARASLRSHRENYLERWAREMKKGAEMLRYYAALEALFKTLSGDVSPEQNFAVYEDPMFLGERVREIWQRESR